jgi:hypothetical protein
MAISPLRFEFYIERLRIEGGHLVAFECREADALDLCIDHWRRPSGMVADLQPLSRTWRHGCRHWGRFRRRKPSVIRSGARPQDHRQFVLRTCGSLHIPHTINEDYNWRRSFGIYGIGVFCLAGVKCTSSRSELGHASVMNYGMLVQRISYALGIYDVVDPPGPAGRSCTSQGGSGIRATAMNAQFKQGGYIRHFYPSDKDARTQVWETDIVAGRHCLCGREAQVIASTDRRSQLATSNSMSRNIASFEEPSILGSRRVISD